LGTEITHCRTGTGGLTWQEIPWRAILASILQPAVSLTGFHRGHQSPAALSAH